MVAKLLVCTHISGDFMILQTNSMLEFREKLKALSREELLEIIQDQDTDPEFGYMMQIDRIEYVFRKKLQHLTWDDGSPIIERPLTEEELMTLIDPPFIYDKELAKLGFSEAQQKQIHIASDPVLWAKNFLGAEPRVYQTLVLREPHHRRVMRFGRRMGKTFTLAILVLWYAYTNQNMRIIIVAPMKSQVGLIYESVMDLADKNEVVRSSIKRNVTSPQYEIEFSNGSSIRFFTTGMKSNGKADVTRGQEADIIILDEMDYMGKDDLVALLAMLQKTSKEKRVKKLMVAASTPTGQRNTFWSWCTNPEDNFKAFWFPAMANPFWDAETEAQMRRDYPREVDWCHEVEAGWGEDAEGVYPHRFVKPAFIDFSSPYNLNSRGEPVKFQYEPIVFSNNSFFVFGVDWDKYAAGVNILVLEICNDRYEDERFAGKIRLCYREEVRKDEYTYTASVERIKELNAIFRPQHIYVDRGAGETQIELLHQYGMDHPNTRLHKIVKGYQFGESIDVMDPFTKNLVRKELKIFMVDNLSKLLEKNQILFSDHDEELFMQLLSYIVTRRSSVSGRPIFGPGGNTQDHAHDALLLAAFAIAENYDDLLNPKFANKAMSISNEAFLPLVSVNTPEEKEIAREIWGSESKGPVYARRAFSYNRKRGHIKRKMF